MARSSLLRVVLCVLAFVHTYPGRKHLALLFAEPSVGEAWKGIGALVAVGVCCMPIAWFARVLRVLVKRRTSFFLITAALVAAHLVPATDHLPAFLAHPSWADGWRGIGSALAASWFVSPRALKAHVVGALRDERWARLVHGLGGLVASKLPLVVVTGVVFTAGVIAGATHIPTSSAAPARAKPAPTPIELHVPHALGSISVDGELDEPSWDRAARTGAFARGDGAPARPFSEVRATWRDGILYLGLYAADEDIRSSKPAAVQAAAALDDAFNLVLEGTTGKRKLDLSADGRLVARGDGTAAAWEILPTAAHDADGTLDDPADDDEEWVVEVAIPLRELGLRGEKGERLSLTARRCDTPKHQRRTCAAWGEGVLILD